MHILFKKPHKDTYSVRVCVEADPTVELQKIKDTLDPDAYLLAESEIPNHRKFRNAWVRPTSNQGIEVDVSKAKDIHLDRIRRMRDKKLKDLDVEMLKNITNTKKLKEIDAEKQLLRDIPQTLDLSNLDLDSPETLWPAELELCLEYCK